LGWGEAPFHRRCEAGQQSFGILTDDIGCLGSTLRILTSRIQGFVFPGERAAFLGLAILGLFDSPSHSP